MTQILAQSEEDKKALDLKNIEAKTWVENWTKLNSQSIEKYKTQYINHSDLTEIAGLKFQTFTFNTFNLIMPIFVIVLQKQDETADTETIDAGLQGGIIAQIIISVVMIFFYGENLYR